MYPITYDKLLLLLVKQARGQSKEMHDSSLIFDGRKSCNSKRKLRRLHSLINLCSQPPHALWHRIPGQTWKSSLLLKILCLALNGCLPSCYMNCFQKESDSQVWFSPVVWGWSFSYTKPYCIHSHLGYCYSLNCFQGLEHASLGSKSAFTLHSVFYSDATVLEKLSITLSKRAPSRKVMEMDSGDRCTTEWMYLMELNCTVKNG